MATPEATGVRQRAARVEDETENPASLSMDSSKKVPRNKPKVNPPFSNVTFGKFMTYLVLSLVAIGAFYTWRFTVWAADAGGYWNLITGRHAPAKGAGEAAMAAAASAASAGAKGRGRRSTTGKGTDIESQVIQLANSLGIKPADLSSAIRPLIDPTAPNPVEAARVEAEKELLKAKTGSASSDHPTKEGVGILAAAAEALLD